MSRFCPKCGKEIDDTTSFCPYCGNQINAQGRPSTGQQSQTSGQAAPNAGANQGGYVNQGDNTPGKGKAIASLVLGIIAVVCAWFGYSAIVSVITGIAGIILAASAKKDGFVSGMRTAGLVLSLIGLILGAVMFISCVACAGFLFSLGF